MMITKTEKLLLRIGANLHFAVAVGHLACLFFLEYAFRAYGIEDVMMQLCGGHVWMLYAFTVMLAVGLAIAGLYALSAAGDIRRLPLLRLVIWLVVVVYFLRAVIGAYAVCVDFSWLQFNPSLVPAIIACCYLPGLKR